VNDEEPSSGDSLDISISKSSGESDLDLKMNVDLMETDTPL
jgi:hypothetical protein